MNTSDIALFKHDIGLDPRNIRQEIRFVEVNAGYGLTFSLVPSLAFTGMT